MAPTYANGQAAEPAHLENGHSNGSSNGSTNDKPSPNDEDEKRLSWTTWIEERFNFSWFTCTQSTGGVAAVISECPKQFDGLQTTGTIVFILNLVLFATFNVLLVVRWLRKPSSIRPSLTKAPECFFYGSWFLTIATIIICIERYGAPHCGPWLATAIRVMFWIYAACTLLSTIVTFVVMSRLTTSVPVGRNPGVLLTVFQAMLAGTVAAAIAEGQPDHQRLPIIAAGVAIQGYGWIMCMFYMTHILYVLLDKGWPLVNLRPGLFMMVGTSGFTIVALIGCARAAPDGYGYFAVHPMAAEILRIVATWTGIFMWVFTFWAFGTSLLITTADVLSKEQSGTFQTNMTFNNVWWAFIFPNVGFTLGTIYIGRELESNAIDWVSTVMVILLVMMWLVNLGLMAKAIIRSLFWDSRIKLS